MDFSPNLAQSPPKSAQRKSSLPVRRRKGCDCASKENPLKSLRRAEAGDGAAYHSTKPSAIVGKVQFMTRELDALRAVRGVLFDMDGVIYVGTRPLPGVQEAIDYLTLELNCRYLETLADDELPIGDDARANSAPES